ncbi:putative fucose kinase [Trypanosoma rangeli]|uniref:Putative fucose kinase n=1 Tax=Trypanosoma rangeli TaxID=5698 RepID=A0A422N943_TRYRA|nr:putative fucose kinase [Trypanosoma rangeli]RNF01994.1 putative fucose kinase [Trypanosoma rangeli]|eukprot:RNF01994.1 putative fucose kinase [Trypanosoma rangeli]
MAPLNASFRLKNKKLFLACEPEECDFVSGGRTRWLLESCYQFEREAGATEADEDFERWLSREQRILIYGADANWGPFLYWSYGRPLVPISAFCWTRGQTCDRTLLGLQAAALPGGDAAGTSALVDICVARRTCCPVQAAAFACAIGRGRGLLRHSAGDE